MIESVLMGLRIMEVEKIISKNFSCEICHKKFTQKGKWKVHLQSHQARIKCGLCDKTFIYKSHLKDHMDEKHDKKSFECHICNKMFNGRTQLVNHIRFKHVNVNQELKCDACNKSFKYKHSLDEHIESQHKHKTFDEKSQNGRISYQCKYCVKQFVSKKCCLNHINKCHTKHQCIKCDKVFVHKKTYLNHFNTIHADNDAQSQFKCQECFKQFTYQKAFQTHLETHNVTSRDKVVMQIELKKVHKLEINTKGNFVQAVKAGKRSRLTIEDQTQDVEESYQCEQCNATFDIEDDFLEHIFTPHESESPLFD